MTPRLFPRLRAACARIANVWRASRATNEDVERLAAAQKKRQRRAQRALRTATCSQMKGMK